MYVRKLEMELKPLVVMSNVMTLKMMIMAVHGNVLNVTMMIFVNRMNMNLLHRVV
jgi:hypothetical protein